MFDQIKDNAFAYARLWFKNMDKLIEVMNEHAGLELTHSYFCHENCPYDSLCAGFILSFPYLRR